MTADRRCRDCEALLPEEAAFCATCGGTVDPDTAGRSDASKEALHSTATPEQPAGAEPKREQPSEAATEALLQTAAREDWSTSGEERRPQSKIRRAATAIGVLVVLAGAAFAAGFLTADDSDQVSLLQNELSAARSDAKRSQNELASSRSENAEREEEVTALQERLEAELGLKGKRSSPTTSISPADADLRVGEAGKIGALIVKPTSFQRSGSSGDAVSYVASFTVKNDGSVPVGPFCGGGEATVEDTDGRSFDGDSILGETTPNCGDDIQPGLTTSNFQVRFKLPRGAKAAILRVTDAVSDSGEEKTWAVR